jgi:hypothetical protein
MGEYCPCCGECGRSDCIHWEGDQSGNEHWRASGPKDGQNRVGGEQNRQGECISRVVRLCELIHSDFVHCDVRAVRLPRSSQWLQRPVVYIRLPLSNIVLFDHTYQVT